MKAEIVKRFKYTISTNKVGSRCEGVVEVDDEDAANPEVLEDIMRDAAFNDMEWNFQEVK